MGRVPFASSGDQTRRDGARRPAGAVALQRVISASVQLVRGDLFIKFYEPWLGPFPFREFNIIEMNDLGWGQAPPGIMFITKEAFNPLINVESRLYSRGVNQRFVHEIAHQYWGIVVKMGHPQEQWLTESFSELCSCDPKFFSWLRNLQGQYAWRFLTTSDAAKLLQRIDGGKDYQPFLASLPRPSLLLRNEKEH